MLVEPAPEMSDVIKEVLDSTSSEIDRGSLLKLASEVRIDVTSTSIFFQLN
jgi:hypothetical protein